MKRFREDKSQLRSVAQDLKRCQLQYFVLSITGTGVILSFSKQFDNYDPSIVILSPLLIILPCWLMFFDKATTLTRLIGYIRLLEYIISNTDDIEYIYVGYENALKKFREKENHEQVKIYEGVRLKNCDLLLLWSNRHQFWVINWWTFASLSIVCWVTALLSSPSLYSLSYVAILSLLISLVFIVFCGFYTFALIYHLIRGRFSYNSVTEFWESIVLSRQPDNDPQEDQ